MSNNLVEEIAAKAATLPIEQQQKVLEVVEMLTAQVAQPRCDGASSVIWNI